MFKIRCYNNPQKSKHVKNTYFWAPQYIDITCFGLFGYPGNLSTAHCSPASESEARLQEKNALAVETTGSSVPCGHNRFASCKGIRGS